jgi:hypothetical protein
MMRRAHMVLLAAAALASVQSACGPAAQNQSPAPPTSSQVPAAQSASISPVASVLPGSSPDPEAQTSIDAAVRDAAAHLNVGVAELRVEQVEARQWSDSSLGCPRPGVMYSQVVTPGFLIVIREAGAGGKQLEYHSDARGRVVLCQER